MRLIIVLIPPSWTYKDHLSQTKTSPVKKMEMEKEDKEDYPSPGNLAKVASRAVLASLPIA
jgi:hypothetical protein